MQFMLCDLFVLIDCLHDGLLEVEVEVLVELVELGRIFDGLLVEEAEYALGENGPQFSSSFQQSLNKGKREEV